MGLGFLWGKQMNNSKYEHFQMPECITIKSKTSQAPSRKYSANPS